jgi:hypothetical protein
MDPSRLVEVGGAAVVGALTKAAAEPALTAGVNVWAWLKGKLSSSDAEFAASVEADPGKPSAITKVQALLLDVLHDDNGAADELQSLLGGNVGAFAVAQTINISGVRNNVTQISGSGNIISIEGHAIGVAPDRPWPRG